MISCCLDDSQDAGQIVIGIRSVGRHQEGCHCRCRTVGLLAVAVVQEGCQIDTVNAELRLVPQAQMTVFKSFKDLQTATMYV